MDVITLGETMVLLTPESVGLMRYANQFGRKFGGAESNVAIGLSRLGHQVGWMSRVGDDEFGRAMVAFIRGEGVDVSQVTVDPSAPTGLYFKEIRRKNDVHVYYYRSHSAASHMKPEHISEGYIAQAKYLHITGITPALSDSCRETIFHVIRIAKSRSVKVTFDPNLRKKLLTGNKDREMLLSIAAQADVVLPSVEEGEFMLNVTDPHAIAEGFFALGVPQVVVKVGAKGSIAYTQEGHIEVPGFHVEHMVDPVGAGDAFAAGFLSAQLDGLPLESSLQRANALGAMATMVSGDVEGLPDKDELKRFIQGDAIDVIR